MPRRAGRAGSGAAPFPLPLPLCSRPVTASSLASRLSPAPCVGRAAGPAPATRAPPGLRLRHGSRPGRLPLRPPASRRHGCLPLPAQHGEVLRGRGRRLAPAAALRLLRHAGLARLHGGEAGEAQRRAAAGREPDSERERGGGGWGHPPGRVRIRSLQLQLRRQFDPRQREWAPAREGTTGAWEPCVGGRFGGESSAMWGEAPSAH